MLKRKKLIIGLLCVFVPVISNAQTYYGGNQQNPNVYYGNNSYGGGYKEKYNFNNNKPSIRAQNTQTQTAPQKVQTQQTTANLNLAKESESVYYVKGTKPCWEDAAARHNVDPWLLYSIASVESGFNNVAFNGNKNGSYDIGMMQINSIWLPKLKTMGISRDMLKDACTSTYVGAWILSQNIKRFGYTWRAIGAYNSAKPSLGYKYALKVYKAHQKYTGQVATGWK